jgi:hypothetical protein
VPVTTINHKDETCWHFAAAKARKDAKGTDLVAAKRNFGMRIAIPLAFVLVPFISSCTSIRVDPVASGTYISHVCIENNPRVIRSDFLPAVRDGFDRHHISTSVYEGAVPPECEYLLSYTATQTWDMAMVMKDAELRLRKNGELIGTAIYHLNGGGGLSLFKWQGSETKMTPVIDELLANVNTSPKSSESSEGGTESTTVENPGEVAGRVDQKGYKPEVEKVAEAMECKEAISLKEATSESESWHLDCGDGESLEVKCFDGTCYIEP